MAIEDVDAGYCRLGVKVKKGGTYRDNYIHHNPQYGMEGTGESGIILERQRDRLQPDDTNYDLWDSGAFKFYSTVGMVVRDNHVHDNNGHRHLVRRPQHRGDHRGQPRRGQRPGRYRPRTRLLAHHP